MDIGTRERILTLLDELLRRGVPMAKLYGILDWLDVDGARLGLSTVRERMEEREKARGGRTPGDMGD